jgi:hypothetical protein
MKLNTLYRRNSDPALYQEDYEETNCGSFALGVTEWYTPYITDDDCPDELYQYSEIEREDYIYQLFADGYSIDEVMDIVIERDFEFILKTCNWLVPIKKEEILPTDRVIAYRLSIKPFEDLEDFDADAGMDFHFRVLIDGEWCEKNGAGPVHKVTDPDEEIWIVEDWLEYRGPIKYARFKEV